jgi:hypothetical protein
MLPTAAVSPALDGIDGDSGRLAGGFHDDHAGIAAHVVDTVRECYAPGIRGEVVVVHFLGLALPGSATVFQTPNQLLLLAIAAHDGQIGRLEFAALGVDVQELPIASGSVPALVPQARFEVLAVRLEREAHLAQEPPDSIGADLDADRE